MANTTSLSLENDKIRYLFKTFIFLGFHNSISDLWVILFLKLSYVLLRSGSCR